MKIGLITLLAISWSNGLYFSFITITELHEETIGYTMILACTVLTSIAMYLVYTDDTHKTDIDNSNKIDDTILTDTILTSP